MSTGVPPISSLAEVLTDILSKPPINEGELGQAESWLAFEDTYQSGDRTCDHDDHAQAIWDQHVLSAARFAFQVGKLKIVVPDG